jgi:hypothetical protein
VQSQLAEIALGIALGPVCWMDRECGNQSRRDLWFTKHPRLPWKEQLAKCHWAVPRSERIGLWFPGALVASTPLERMLARHHQHTTLKGVASDVQARIACNLSSTPSQEVLHQMAIGNLRQSGGRTGLGDDGTSGDDGAGLLSAGDGPGLAGGEDGWQVKLSLGLLSEAGTANWQLWPSPQQ